MRPDARSTVTLPPMGSFVFLEHQYPPPQESDNHWDLMFESGDGLVTFATEPLLVSGSSSRARLLPLHRVDYLDYEGPISDNRGHVRRLDRGYYRQIEPASQGLTIEVSGQMFVGRLVLQPLSDQDDGEVSYWQLRWTPLPHTGQ